MEKSPRAAGSSRRYDGAMRRSAGAYAFIAFPMAVLFLFTLLPTAAGLVLSLFEWDGGEHARFVGLANFQALLDWFANQSGRGGGLLGLYDLFTGGNLSRATVFALGIMPYITSSIILQLLTVLYEPLQKLSKEGELGRKKITMYTRYLTLLLSTLQSMFIAIGLQKGGGFVPNPGAGFVLMTSSR